MARNRKPTMTSRQYGKRAVFVSDYVRFQDGDAVDIVKQGGGQSVFFFFLSMSALSLVYVVIMYTHRTTVFCYGAAACATFGYFLCTMHVNVRGV